MKITFSSIFILIILYFQGDAQPSIGQKIGKWDNQIFISDVSGRPVRSGYVDVTGHPFFVNEFKFGSIELVNGRKFVDVPLRIDIVTHEVNFISPNKEEGYLGGAMIKEVIFIDSSLEIPTRYVFKSNVPAIDNHTSAEFFQVLSNGKLILLKSVTKRIDTRKNELSGEIVKEFATYTDYYYMMNGKIQRFKREKDFISDITSDKREKMETFLKNFRNNIKNDVDLGKIIDYYNM